MASWICCFFVLHWLTKNLFVTKLVWFQAKSRQWEIWKTQLFWFFSFLYQKLMNALVVYSGLFVWFFIKKSGLTQSWMGNLRPLKNLELASDPFWSIALSNLLQPHSLCWRSLYSASRIPLGHQKRSKTFAQVYLTSFFYEAAAFRTKGNSRVCCWSVQHCTVKASNLERRPATRRRAAASSGGGAHWWLLSLKKVS